MNSPGPNGDFPDQTQGLILAAGCSRRTAPEHKMVLPWRGSTIIESVARTLKTVCFSVIVVVGFRKEAVQHLFEGDARVQCVINPEYEKSMFLSVLKGIEHVSGKQFFLLPGDYPLIKETTLQFMLQYQSSASIILPTCNGRKGHPVLLKSSLIPALGREPKTSTLKHFVERTGYDTIEVDDPGILIDIDDRETYHALVRKYGITSEK